MTQGKPSHMGSTDASPLTAHSLAEAYFYLMVTPCPSCGEGPLRSESGQRTSPTQSELRVCIEALCGKCGQSAKFDFRLPSGAGTRGDAPAIVNPTVEPSEIIDVAQWLTLFRTVAEAASRDKDKVQARHLGLEAAQCLDEALKFYQDDNDLPPRDAFFSDTSRERLERNPEQFSRQRLINLRAKLPTCDAMRAAIAAPPAKKKWWRFGR